jgi:hypothetical protein
MMVDFPKYAFPFIKNPIPIPENAVYIVCTKW